MTLGRRSWPVRVRVATRSTVSVVFTASPLTGTDIRRGSGGRARDTSPPVGTVCRGIREQGSLRWPCTTPELRPRAPAAAAVACGEPIARRAAGRSRRRRASSEQRRVSARVGGDPASPPARRLVVRIRGRHRAARRDADRHHGRRVARVRQRRRARTLGLRFPCAHAWRDRVALNGPHPRRMFFPLWHPCQGKDESPEALCGRSTEAAEGPDFDGGKTGGPDGASGVPQCQYRDLSALWRRARTPRDGRQPAAPARPRRRPGPRGCRPRRDRGDRARPPT
jgi:hypothetical protein